MARIRKKHSPAFKAQVALEAAKQAKTIAELAKQFQVHPVQISQWKKQLLDGMETLFQNSSATRQADPEKLQAELYEQLGRLQMELAWVKIRLMMDSGVVPAIGRSRLPRAAFLSPGHCERTRRNPGRAAGSPAGFLDGAGATNGATTRILRAC